MYLSHENLLNGELCSHLVLFWVPQDEVVLGINFCICILSPTTVTIPSPRDVVDIHHMVLTNTLKTHTGESTASWANSAGRAWRSLRAEPRLLLLEINSNQVKDLNMRYETLKVLEEDTSRCRHRLNLRRTLWKGLGSLRRGEKKQDLTTGISWNKNKRTSVQPRKQSSEEAVYGIGEKSLLVISLIEAECLDGTKDLKD